MKENVDKHDINSIKSILPHREPFLFLDRLQDIEPPYRGKGFVTLPIQKLKNLPLFDLKLILIEFSAQTSAYVAVYDEDTESRSNKGYLVTIKDFISLKPDISLEKDQEFMVSVELLKHYKALYRYKFTIKDILIGELEFITEQ